MIVIGSLAAANRVAGGGGGGFADIAHVNSDGTVNTGSGTSLAAPALAVTAGNLLIASVCWMYDAGTVSIADTAGNTWYPLANRSTPSNQDSNQQIFYAYNVAAHATNVVTATWSAARQFRSVIVAQYSGVENASDPFAQENGDTTEATGTRSAPVSLSGAAGIKGLVVAAIGLYNAEISAGWGVVANRKSVAGNYAHFADKLNVTAGTTTPTWTTTQTRPVLGVALFKAKAL